MEKFNFNIASYWKPIAGIVIGIILDAISLAIPNQFISVSTALIGTSISLISIFFIIIREVNDLKLQIIKSNTELQVMITKLFDNFLKLERFYSIEASEALNKITKNIDHIEEIYNFRLRSYDKNPPEIQYSIDDFRDAVFIRFGKKDLKFKLIEILANFEEIIEEGVRQKNNYKRIVQECASEGKKYNSKYEAKVIKINEYINDDILLMELRNFMIIKYFDGLYEIYFGWGSARPNNHEIIEFRTYMSMDKRLIEDYMERFKWMKSKLISLEEFIMERETN